MLLYVRENFSVSYIEKNCAKEQQNWYGFKFQASVKKQYKDCISEYLTKMMKVTY